MSIKGLTDHSNPGAGLPLIARLFKGEARPEDGKRPGKDLAYFRVEFEAQFERRFETLRTTWESLYGEKPTEFAPCLFAMATADEAFSSWNEQWDSKGLLRRCDGENQVRWYDSSVGQYFSSRVACLKGGMGCECRPVGRLNILLPEFIEATGCLGYVSLTTHSINDIATIYRYLVDIEAMYGRLTGVPFVFGRANKQMPAPKTDKSGNRTGERIKITRSMLYIHVLPEFTSSVLLPAVMSAARRQEAPALPEVTTDEVRDALGSGGAPRRVGAPVGNRNDESTEIPWTADEERWQGFLTWATGKFQWDQDMALEAMQQAVDYPVLSPGDWKESDRFAMAALIAAGCEYDIERIEQACKGLKAETCDAAVKIAEQIQQNIPF